MSDPFDSDEDLGINRSIFENSLDAILLTKPDGTILAANPAAKKMFGMTENEFKAAGRDTIVVQDENLKSALEEQAQKGRFKAEIMFKRKDGSTFPGEMTSTPFTDKNGTLKANMIITNITKRKKAEEQLKASEEDYRHLLQYAPTAIYEIDFKGPRFKSVNDALCQLSGYSKEELLSTNPLDLLNSESQERFQQRIRKGFAGAKIDEKVDYTVIHKDGRKLWVTLNIKPTYTNGKIDGALVVGHDITARKKVETERERLFQELQHSQKRLEVDLYAMERLHKLSTLFLHKDNMQTVLEDIVDTAIAICGSDFGNIQLLDPDSAHLKIAAHRGFPKWWLDFWNDVHKGQGVCGTALESGERIIVEDVEHSPIFIGTPALDIQLKAGVRAVQSTPIISRSGKPLGMFSTHYKTPHQLDTHELQLLDLLAQQAADIIEKGHYEEALQRSEERYRSILDNIQDAYMRGNNEGVITMASPSAARMYGFDSPQEMIGVPNLWLYKNPEDRNYVLEELKKHGKVEDYESQGLRTDGTSFSVSMNAQFHYDDQGQIQGTEAFVRDITERKQAEIKLKETLDNLEEMIEDRTKELLLANDYNRNLIETSLDPLVTIGPDGKITDVNRATEEVTGYSREELVGTDFADYFTNPEKAKEGYQEVFEEGEVRDYPLKIKHKYGNTIPVLYNASVYKNESGDVVGVFAAARDITERQKAEDAFRVYWESLEEQVKQRTEELAKSNADLKQFAYVASHDLREPLRMITSFLQLLERRYKDQLDEDANEFIGFAVDGAKRMDTMIMDLLEYSRVANKEMTYNDVNIEKILNQIKSNLSVLIDENNASITSDPLPNIRVDENQMILLFQNIISNAIKYRREENPRIHISTEKEGDKYVFRVKDNGIGIDPQHLERIFTIFKRLHTHEEYEGSGIGLSIAQRIVHQHGGEIWAESEPGKGSTFYFTIPIN